MRYAETAVALRDGTSCALRSPEPEEAAAVLAFLRQTADETQYLARCADEIVMTAEEERDYLARRLESPDACMIAAYIQGELAGTTGMAPVAESGRCRHRATFGLAVRRDYWHLGAGSALLSAVIETAGAAGFERLELEVVAENTRAAALYKRFGFETCGTWPRACKYPDGTYADYILMSRAL